MKIIISPSKTQDLQKSMYLEDKEILYPNKTNKILAKLRKLTKNELGTALNIKSNILDNTYRNIKNYNQAETYHAFPSFNGLVFHNLDQKTYKENEYMYIKNHVRILDALYGVLEPGTLIKPYRLDMKAKLGINLYHHWELDDYFTDEVIINLSSTEFSKILHLPLINIHFLQNKAGKHINQATYSKMARGMFLDFLIKNKVTDIEIMRSFDKDKYSYNMELSDAFNLTFTR